MTDTHFVNCHRPAGGGHVTSACDIALMSRELILKPPGHPPATPPSGWILLRDGAFQPGQHQQADPLLRRGHGPEDRLHRQRAATACPPRRSGTAWSSSPWC
ncbi:MAG: hypothetical protein ACLU38_16000 [Dysosmobacter sp.]